MLIRLCYPKLNDESKWRFQYFEDSVLPRIERQQRGDFDLWIWTNPLHAKKIEAMSPRIKTFSLDYDPLASRVPWSIAKAQLPQYAVQLRLDSDDLIDEHYVEAAMVSLVWMRKFRALAYFVPWKFDLATGKAYAFHRQYSIRKPSPFLALKQPLHRPGYDWVYGRGHTSAHRLANEVREIPAGHCWMTVHRYNDSTVLHRRDVEIDHRP
jgi:hypothetical protein